ncbi:MAG: NUDIX hydrolase, partial [Candidatus Micrarchaeaceae archaeon]
MDLRTHGVIALVRDETDRFLLLEDARDGTKGLWAPPHGRCEASDGTEEDSVIREVQEETCLDVLPVRKVLTQAADTKRKTVSFWTVTINGGAVLLNNESSASDWFTVEESLDLPLYPGTKAFFEKVLRGD